MQAKNLPNMDCQPVVQLRCTTAVETAPCTSVAFGSKKCIFRFRSSNFILNTPVTCLLNPCDTIWRYIIHANGLYTSFAVLQETPYFFYLNPPLRAGGYASSSKGCRFVGSSGIADVTSSWACFNQHAQGASYMHVEPMDDHVGSKYLES